MSARDDRNLMEIKLCEQEITKLDVDVKKRIGDLLKLSNDTTQQKLTVVIREIKAQLVKLEDKIGLLERIAGKCNFQGEDGNALREELKSHQEELAKNREQLRCNTLRASKDIDQYSRNKLFEQNSEELEVRRRKQNQEGLMQTSSKKTDSLSKLVSRMGEQLKLSEETTSALIHSSAVLQDTDQQFTTMGATIKVCFYSDRVAYLKLFPSGGKLLSKYSRRETTDKILIAIALLLYFGTIYYILRKRAFSFLF